MTNWQDPVMVFPAPAKEFRPEKPSAPLYPDKFPELVERRVLRLGRREYDEVLEQRGKLVRFNDESQFVAWMMRRFDLEPFHQYDIKVED